MTAARPEQLTRLAVQFADHGITERADRLRLCSDHAGRRLTSSAQLTEAEAARLVTRLDGLPPGSLRPAVARLVAAEEEAAARAITSTRAAAIVCTRGATGPLTDHDRQVIAQFGEALDNGGQLTIGDTEETRP